jgi:hypothetical protein
VGEVLDCGDSFFVFEDVSFLASEGYVPARALNHCIHSPNQAHAIVIDQKPIEWPEKYAQDAREARETLFSFFSCYQMREDKW